jgi:hypothetical protein
MNEKVLFGPKFGTLINRKWITNIWVVTPANLVVNQYGGPPLCIALN